MISTVVFLHTYRWNTDGGRVDTTCGVIHEANSLVFDGSGDRKACTPYMDARSAGNLRFYFGMGNTVYISKFIYISKASRILINFTYNAVKQINLARCMLIMLYVGKQKLLTII